MKWSLHGFCKKYRVQRSIFVIAFLGAMLLLAPTPSIAAPFIKGPYTAVGIGITDDQSPLARLLLLGGSQNGTWYRHTDLPVTVQGIAVTPKNAMDYTGGEDFPCETPLASPMQSLTLYSANGKIGEASIARTLLFVSSNSGEMYIAAGLTEPVKAGNGMIVGVNGNWDAMPVTTTRTEDEKSITFSASAESSFASVVLTKAQNAEGAAFFKGDAVVRGNIYDVGSFYLDDENLISGFFIDLNGDGIMEFIIEARGVDGSVSVLSITQDGAARVMSLEFGD